MLTKEHKQFIGLCKRLTVGSELYYLLKRYLQKEADSNHSLKVYMGNYLPKDQKREEEKKEPNYGKWLKVALLVIIMLGVLLVNT